MNLMILLAVIAFVCLWLLSCQRQTTEAFVNPETSNEKRKNILLYLGFITSRSPVGSWTQDEDNSFQALKAIFISTAELKQTTTSTGIYYAQAHLNKAGSYTGTVDGVSNSDYVSAVNKFLAEIDPATTKIVAGLTTLG